MSFPLWPSLQVVKAMAFILTGSLEKLKYSVACTSLPAGYEGHGLHLHWVLGELNILQWPALPHHGDKRARPAPPRCRALVGMPLHVEPVVTRVANKQRLTAPSMYTATLLLSVVQ
mmetsp:Transcript_11863/g.19692  ORF Transcript_11863/g.19692 Transcript_11863/m.19692 type:complete len:116 (+) Transcript_11863:147-494(+)